MPISNAALLASNPTSQYLIENSPRKLQIARIMPFLGVPGGSLSYARVASFIGQAAEVLCDRLAETAFTAEQASFGFAELLTRHSVCFSDQDRYRDPNNIEAALYALSVRRLLYGYFAGLDGLAGTVLGLRTYMDLTNRAVNMMGGALTLDCLDQAYHLVEENDGHPTVIMSATRALRTYHKLWHDFGEPVPQVPWQWYDPAIDEMVDGFVTAFNGTPWLINDLMAGYDNTEPTEQRIYFMVLGDSGKAGPSRGVTGIVPEDLQESMFVTRTTHGVPNGASADTIPADDTWVSWPVGIAVPSQAAISMIHNFTPITDCELGV